MKRRTLIGSLLAATAALLLQPLRALAAWNSKAFSAATEQEAVAAFFGDETITPSDDIEIGMRDLVENGAVVPIQVRTGLPEPQSVTLFVENNPNPLIAHFEFGPGCRGFIATRIKVGAPSDVTVVVRARDGLFSARRYVEVVEGGCN
jgi:sulfur-oxidizing protein SoxY